jgi:amino-acid N-acetyltransferase
LKPSLAPAHPLFGYNLVKISKMGYNATEIFLLGGRDLVINLRKANMSDIESMASLINEYANQGLMLHRTLASMYQRIRDYTVVEKKGVIVGLGGLHILWKDLAEICSLAVHPQHTKQNLGKTLVEHLLREGRELQIEKIFALTFQPLFFEKCGFTRIDKKELPQKVWTECINCPHFPDCKEIALIKIIS